MINILHNQSSGSCSACFSTLYTLSAILINYGAPFQQRVPLCLHSLILSSPLVLCPQPVKGAKIKTLLILVPEILNNHRPISNLPFISKVLEDTHLTDDLSSKRGFSVDKILCTFFLVWLVATHT